MWYVKHHRDDRPVETIRCRDLRKAWQMRLDLEEVGEIAWVENERRLKIQDWELRGVY